MSRHAYTLVEVVLATAIIAIVLLGAQSAVVVASRAIPSGTSGPSAVAAAAGAMASMADDVSAATAFGTMGAADLQFTVPDRNGDSVDDVIRYTWSGKAGDPLLRTVNGGQPAVAAAGVQEFALTYDTTQAALPTTYSDGAESALFAYAPGSAAGAGTIMSSKWWAQYFKPTLATGVRSWTVTRVTFTATKHSGNTGQARAQLRPDAAGSPGVQVLGETTILESSMDSSWGTTTAPYNCVSGLTPGQGLWFVLQWVSDTEAFDIQYKTGVSIGAGAPLETSGNSGSSWSTLANSEMVFTVYGKVCTADPVQYRTAVSGVRCRLRSGATSAVGLSQTWRVLNQPTAVGP